MMENLLYNFLAGIAVWIIDKIYDKFGDQRAGQIFQKYTSKYKNTPRASQSPVVIGWNVTLNQQIEQIGGNIGIGNQASALGEPAIITERKVAESTFLVDSLCKHLPDETTRLVFRNDLSTASGYLTSDQRSAATAYYRAYKQFIEIFRNRNEKIIAADFEKSIGRLEVISNSSPLASPSSDLENVMSSLESTLHSFFRNNH